MSYYVIDPNSDPEVYGPFESLTECEQWIRQDTEDSYLDADKSIRDSDPEKWSGKLHIVKLVKTVQPIPQVSINVRLKTYKQETNRE